jgi:hypothetical protein
MNLPGKIHFKYQNGQENKISFKMITQVLEEGRLLKPKYQTDMDEDKINEMIQSYLKNPTHLIFKNKIVIAVINEEKLYLIDGQHRLQMARELYLNYDKDDELYLCYFYIKTDDDMKELFYEINKDSYKNYNYITLDEFNSNLYDYTRLYLERNYRDYFSQKKNTNKVLYSISEFMMILAERNFFNNYTKIEDIINEIENKNNKFYKLISYRDYYIEDKNSFYVDEHECINQQKIIGLKNNNFIDYLLDNTNKTIPDHKFKYKKQKIQPRLRIEVWKKEFGENEEGICPLCNTTRIHIGKNGFHCSHIKSEKNGGATDITNLRPLCDKCNLKMGTRNWYD